MHITPFVVPVKERKDCVNPTHTVDEFIHC